MTACVYRNMSTGTSSELLTPTQPLPATTTHTATTCITLCLISFHSPTSSKGSTSSPYGLASMTCFYFDFRDVNKQNRRDLLLSLITQLSDQYHRHCDIYISS